MDAKERYEELCALLNQYSTLYYDQDDPAVSDREYDGLMLELKAIEAEVRPFAGLKTIIIERDMGCPMPAFREALSPILRP